MDRFSEQITDSVSKEELDTLKHQLFMENVRIQSEKSQIESDTDVLRKERKELHFEKKQLSREKKQLNMELSQLKAQVEYERKRLKDEEKLIEKKLKILQKSYELFEQDKENLRKEQVRLERERELLKSQINSNKASARKEVYATGVFFRGVNNEVALKKRYKELMKIYHPDNICGDNEILLKINEEYNELRKRFDLARKA